MTSTYSNLNEPFLLSPAGKDYLWGGSRLKDDFNKEIDIQPLAETWECSTHPDGISTVASGVYKGMLLSDVLKAHPEYMGKMHQHRIDGQLPILIKLIDAKQDLSVQVHPDDKYAAEHENGQLGKTEMWYVLDSKRDTNLVYGFHHAIGKEKLKEALETGKIEKYLQKVSIKKDDVFFIEPGQVHAIGAGALVAEIQECSNLTYRLYDYNRVDKIGNKRELHIDKALDVANLNESIEPRQPMRTMNFYRGFANELLCRCQYFQVERMLLNTERCRTMASVLCSADSATILMCVDGCGNLTSQDGDIINFVKGDTIFVPASLPLCKLHGKAQILKVTY